MAISIGIQYSTGDTGVNAYFSCSHRSRQPLRLLIIAELPPHPKPHLFRDGITSAIGFYEVPKMADTYFDDWTLDPSDIQKPQEGLWVDSVMRIFG